MEYRGIKFSVALVGGLWQYHIPPNPLWKIKCIVPGFGSRVSAQKAAENLIDDWYVSQ